MRILVVDDEQRLAASIARGLHAEGFATDVVHDGLDALWQAHEVASGAIVTVGDSDLGGARFTVTWPAPT